MANITSNPYQGWATITNKLRTLEGCSFRLKVWGMKDIIFLVGCFD